MLEMEYLLKVEWLHANPKKTAKILKSLEERLSERRCLVEGKPLPITLMPLLLSDSERKFIQNTSEVLARCIQKSVEAGFASARVRQYFAYDELPKEWLTSDPGYKAHCIFSRFEALYDGRELKYLEFSTDNPGAQAGTDIVRSVMADHPFYKNLVMFPALEERPFVLEAGLAATKAVFQEFRQGKAGPGKVVFIDYRGSESSLDTQVGVDFFNKHGLSAVLADPRDFQFKDGACYLENERVEMVSRHIKANEFLKYPKELQPFLKGYLSKAFCMVNSFRAVYGNETSILSLMTNTDFHHLYDAQELQVIKNHLPWTRMMSEQETTGPDGTKIKLGDYLRQNRERFILKPSWGGHKVILGIVTPAVDWDRAVTEYLGNAEWVAQAYVPVPRMPVPMLVGNKVVVKKKYYSLHPFVINGKFAEVMGKVSDSPIITLRDGGAILPVMRY